MEFPNDLKYSKDHEWIRVAEDGVTATIGITEFAQSELGDIVFVDLEETGEEFEKDGTFGSVEAVKTVSELFMPLGGTILEHNDELEDRPELINNSPYGDGWIIKITMADPSELDDLMDASEYKQQIGQ